MEFINLTTQEYEDGIAFFIGEKEIAFYNKYTECIRYDEENLFLSFHGFGIPIKINKYINDKVSEFRN